MHAGASPARLAATVARLSEDARHAAGRIVADARDARRQSLRAEAYRRRAAELDRQAHHAEELSRGWAVAASRAAAIEKRLVAEALEIIESQLGL